MIGSNPVSLVMCSAVCFVRFIGDEIKRSGLIFSISLATSPACLSPSSVNSGSFGPLPENFLNGVNGVSP